MNKTINYIVVSITGKCNMSCKGCFRLDQESEMDIDTFEKLHPIFEELGVKSINITGGEPLCNDNVEQLLKISKDWGYQTILSTNGMMINDSNIGILSYVDVLALSLDGDEKAINDKYRVKGHFDSTLELIDRVYNEHHDVKLKINTLVRSENKKNIIGIGDILSKYDDRIICWKLFQISSRGTANLISESERISNEDFESLIFKAKERYSKFYQVNSLMEEEDIDYCIIRCDGSINVVSKGEYVTVNSIDSLPFESNSYNETSLGL